MTSGLAAILPLVGLAWATNYGVPVGGFPSADERSLLLWTNAARVAPDAFGSEYTSGGCSTDEFSDDELTPKPPLYIDLDLTEVARVHSTDMAENGCFTHESCDGTDTWERIGEYYTDASTALGENIAEGYGTPRSTVLTGWMCSDAGHRANIMSGDFNEMGPGVDGEYMTQDFAGGTLSEGAPPVRMAIFEDGMYLADWGDDAEPVGISIVRDGRSTPMELAYGEDANGLYSATGVAQDDNAGEHSWFVSWQRSGDSGAFPETGSWSDDGGYSTTRVDPIDTDGTEFKLVGCATAGAGRGAGLGLAGASLAVLGRRRRAGAR